MAQTCTRSLSDTLSDLASSLWAAALALWPVSALSWPAWFSLSPAQLALFLMVSPMPPLELSVLFLASSACRPESGLI